MHTFDRQTDGQTEFSSLDRVYIPCSALIIYFILLSETVRKGPEVEFTISSRLAQ